MRGRPNDPVRARAKAQAHAKHAYYCSCGKVVYGNGGKAGHFGPEYAPRAGHTETYREQWLQTPAGREFTAACEAQAEAIKARHDAKNQETKP